jgi:hypothetical protein
LFAKDVPSFESGRGLGFRDIGDDVGTVSLETHALMSIPFESKLFRALAENIE